MTPGSRATEDRPGRLLVTRGGEPDIPAGTLSQFPDQWQADAPTVNRVRVQFRHGVDQ